MWILQLCSYTMIPLLSFPVSFAYSKSEQSNKLESFSLGFIRNPVHHPDLLRLLEEGLQTKDKTVAAYCLEISNPSVCEQIINEINQVLRETDSVYDCEQ